MTDRELLIIINRALKMIVAAIEKKIASMNGDMAQIQYHLTTDKDDDSATYSVK